MDCVLATTNPVTGFAPPIGLGASVQGIPHTSDLQTLSSVHARAEGGQTST
jgi:hypothetical protein